MQIGKKKLILMSGIAIVFLIALGLFLMLGKKPSNSSKKETEVDFTNVSLNATVQESDIMHLYKRYHIEDGFKFQIAGSSSMGDDYYAFYYQKDKVTMKDFPDIYKNYILLDLVNYTKQEIDKDRECYLYSLDEFKDLYKKYYGSLDGFSVDTNENFSPRLYLDQNQICIHDKDVNSSSYQYTVDTYMVNGVYENDKVIIYEKVAFIKLSDEKIEFYSDYKRKNKVYTLDRDKADIGFIHSSEIVSNVLLHYQDEFPMYQYTYTKGDGTYYLESITK